TVSGTALRQVIVRATGQLAKHQIHIELIAAENRFDLDATGSYAEGAWQGTLARGQLATKQHGEWRMAQPVALAVRSDNLRLDNWCWQHGQDRLCAEAA